MLMVHLVNIAFDVGSAFSHDDTRPLTDSFLPLIIALIEYLFDLNELHITLPLSLLLLFDCYPLLFLLFRV